MRRPLIYFSIFLTLHLSMIAALSGCSLRQSPGYAKIDLANIQVRLNQLFYDKGDFVSVTVDLGLPRHPAKQIGVVLSSPKSQDIEFLLLNATGDGSTFVTEKPVSITAYTSEADISFLDGHLALQPNEMLFAIYFLNPKAKNKSSLQKGMSSDYGILRDPGFAGSQFRVEPEIALTKDEKKVPPGGKLIGTIARKGMLPVQLPVNELIIMPRSQKQLDQFLAETKGKIIQTNVLPEEQKNGANPTSYLVSIHPEVMNLADLPQMRALFDEKDTLYGSSEDVLRLYAMALYYQMEGYTVGVNPRLVYQGAPQVSEDTVCTPNCRPGIGALTGTMLNGPPNGSPPSCDPALQTSCALNAPKLWAYNALWDGDEERINTAFIDNGFSVNPDFRRPATGGMVQCDMEGRTLLSRLRAFDCAPGIAEGPPTTGGNFFGDRLWHGNGVVSTAGAVVNNGWGAAGVGGQVVVPMLYRFGPTSYVFEMGVGIRKAVIDGASVINISAAYPCNIISNVVLEFNICSRGGRLALCAVVTAALAATVATICGGAAGLTEAAAAAPFPADIALAILAAIAWVACGVSAAALAAEIAVCILAFIPEDPHGPLQRAVNFATSRGVPVVTVAGNVQDREDLPVIIRSLVDLGERRTERWDLVPAMIPETIVVGAAARWWPLGNEEFFGDRVDIWAPVSSMYWAPPNPDIDVPPAQHVQHWQGQTSGAAPYVAGTIAVMQSLNPGLNPRTPGLTPAELAAIPNRIKTLLTNTAFNTAQLVGLATGNHQTPEMINQVNEAGAERRNLINPYFAAVAAHEARASSPMFRAMGYDTALNYDEATTTPSDDFSTGARSVSTTLTGTILTIPGERRAPTLIDPADWFSFQIPGGLTPGLYVSNIHLRTPLSTEYGALFLEGPNIDSVSGMRVPIAAAQDELIVPTFPLLVNSGGGPTIRFRIHGFMGSDNVYKVSVNRPVRIGDLPRADRFDIDDPAVNPPESRPNNNNETRAVHLGNAGEFAWRITSTSSITGAETREISIPNLNFHSADDIDWFSIERFPPFPFYEGEGCRPQLEITFSPGMVLTAIAADGAELVSRQSSPVTIPQGYVGIQPTLFKLEPEEPGRFIEYDLRLSFSTPNERICELADRFSGIGPIGGSGPVPFPKFFPKIIKPGPGPFAGFRRDFDPEGRILTPDPYLLGWSGEGSFRLVAELMEGDSIELTLKDLKGKVVSQVSTSDLRRNIDAESNSTGGANLPVSAELLVLAAPRLPAGDYILEISQGFPGSRLLLTLPRGAISDGSSSVEDYLSADGKK